MDANRSIENPRELPRTPHPARKALARIHPVWWLNATLCLVAGALCIGPVAQYLPMASPHIPWWTLAVAVAVCERSPVHFQFGRSAHSFSLTDIPLTLGCIFASGPSAVFGLTLGTVVAMAMRKVPPIKFVFNVAQFVLALCVAMVSLRLIAGPHVVFGLRLWIGAYLGTQLGGIITILLLAAVMSLADGIISRHALREMFGMDLVVTAVNTSLALISTVFAIAAPSALPILLVPVLIAFFGYRTYVSEHERHRKVEFLYQANRSLAESPEVAVAVEGLLERAREAFRAEEAQIILFSSEGNPPLRTRLGPADNRESLEPVDPTAAAVLRDIAAHGPITMEAPLPPAIVGLTTGHEIRNAMVAVLRSEERVIGTIMLGNRVGLSRGFGSDDLMLFETLAANASAALQFDRLEQAVTELRDLQHQLHHQAYHDPLTGLANRALFVQRVGEALTSDRGVAVMFIDLDDFKAVNDTLGHGLGDRLLLAAAVRLTSSVRDEDLVARLGGDEFAILLCADRAKLNDAASHTAQRVLAGFEMPITIDDRLLSVSLSVGVATDAHGPGSTSGLLRDADVAMYEAKSAGKARYAIFTPKMRETLLRRHTMRDELQASIDEGDLRVYYQPIIDLHTGRMASVEALVRWQHPERGTLAPVDFIPLAEETGLIVPLGRFVLRTACAQAAQWVRADASISMQVNLSPRELEDPDLTTHIEEAIATSGLAPERLTLEITETLLVRDAEAGGARLDSLRELGVRLALDDFGTGYSSLSYLRTLPLDILKIAKPFIDGLTRSKEDEAFVRLIVELARTQGLEVIAEGIEEMEQLHALRAVDCDLGQGYYFARPLPADDERLLEALRAAESRVVPTKPLGSTHG